MNNTNKMKKSKKVKVKSVGKRSAIKINSTNNMNITQLVMTESDGTETASTISTPITKVVATLEDGSTVVVFPTEGTPTPTPETETITIPLDTPIKIVAR